MINGVPNGARIVRCPICADDFYWPEAGPVLVFDQDAAKYRPLDPNRLGPARRAGALRGGYIQCPHPAGDMAAHYLPATYADYRDPLVVGLVGAPMAGKTHLLTAMIREAYRGGLDQYGIRTSALDFRAHNSFLADFVTPFEQGTALGGTANGRIEAADILLVRGPAGERPVLFFDVAGEDLESTEALNRSTRFLLSANAVIFVHAMEDPAEDGTNGAVNPAWSFELAVERLLGVAGNAERIPVAIAVTKSDRMRYTPPVDRWLRRGPEPALDADLIRAESRDAYAYLQRAGAASSLRPFDAFRRCTLHFVSASGGEASPAEPTGRTGDFRFPRGVRPAHVLAPLIAILAMAGVIAGPEAGKVGRP
ncbi:ATP-binding protein [Actinoplanes sp. NPDC049265]|uniref:ATP-binding protein n=1 Tax=Actinoplanes sp. NPDC049265 TaxID=3363902 RepID=UPI0037158186